MPAHVHTSPWRPHRVKHRVFFFGGEGSHRGVLDEALRDAGAFDRAIELDGSDPFAALDLDATACLVVDFDPDPVLALALCRVVRRRLPRVPITAIYRRAIDAARDAAERGAVDVAIDVGLGERATRKLLAARFTGTVRTAVEAEPPGRGHSLDAEDELDALAVLVRGLAHEINNPLTTIRGFVQLLMADDGASSPEELSEALTTMEGESKRIAEVVAELEAFGGGRRPSRSQVDLGALVREALAEAGLGAARVAISLRDELALDADQIRIALRHLFGWCAACAREPRSEVTVTLEPTNVGARLRVGARIDSRTKNGGPFAPLFIPLASARGQGDDRRSLACAFGVARAHGGTLRADWRDGERVELQLDLPRR
jgi:signal transduction histidine kinase